jgi:hypothetical protein
MWIRAIKADYPRIPTFGLKLSPVDRRPVDLAAPHGERTAFPFDGFEIGLQVRNILGAKRGAGSGLGHTGPPLKGG